MKREDISKLRNGDIVWHVGSGEAYVVTFNDGRTVHAVRGTTITNPSEWELFPAHPPLDARKI